MACACTVRTITYHAPDGLTHEAPVRYACAEHRHDKRPWHAYVITRVRAHYLATRAVLVDMRDQGNDGR